MCADMSQARQSPWAMRMSPTWLGVTSMAIGRPAASTTAWIFVVRPPRDRPIACADVPLFRPPPIGEPWQSNCRETGLLRAMLGSAPRTGVARGRASPTAESGCRSSLAAHRGLAILPATTNLQDMHDPADNAPVIVALRTRLVLRKQWFNRRPLLIAQPEFARHRPSLQPTRLESQTRSDFNDTIEFGA